MSNIKEARKAITSTFLNSWGSTTSVALENLPFQQPESSPWVRFIMQHNFGENAALGTNGLGAGFFRRFGLIFVQVFTVRDTGTNQNDELCQKVLDIFEGKHINDIWFSKCRVKDTGTDGKFYQQNAIIEFQYDQIKT